MENESEDLTKRPWPTPGETYTIIIAVSQVATPEHAPFVILQAPEEVVEAFLEWESESAGEKSGLPKAPGVHILTISYWFEAGYFEGHPAPGENDYGFEIIAAKPLFLTESDEGLAGAPIPMVLHCPHCGTQHIDKPEPEKGWTNPRHRTHLCRSCGLNFRPCDLYTTGVEKVATHGELDGQFLPEYPPVVVGSAGGFAVPAELVEDMQRLTEGSTIVLRQPPRLAISDKELSHLLLRVRTMEFVSAADFLRVNYHITKHEGQSDHRTTMRVEDAVACMEALNELTDEEGVIVHVVYPNPDGPPDYSIEVENIYDKINPPPGTDEELVLNWKPDATKREEIRKAIESSWGGQVHIMTAPIVFPQRFTGATRREALEKAVKAKREKQKNGNTTRS